LKVTFFSFQAIKKYLRVTSLWVGSDFFPGQFDSKVTPDDLLPGQSCEKMGFRLIFRGLETLFLTRQLKKHYSGHLLGVLSEGSKDENGD